MAVDPTKRAQSELTIEEGEADGLAFIFDYQLPYDRYKRTGFWKRELTGTSGSFTTEINEFQAVIVPFDGSFNLGQRRHCIFDMSPFETANERQWSGSETILIKGTWKVNEDKIEETERPLWAVSGFDASKGERIIAGVAHGDKDGAFTVQVRLNMILDYVRQLIRPYQSEVRTNFKEQRAFPDGTASSHHNQHEMLSEIIKAYQDNKPHWDF